MPNIKELFDKYTKLPQMTDGKRWMSFEEFN